MQQAMGGYISSQFVRLIRLFSDEHKADTTQGDLSSLVPASRYLVQVIKEQTRDCVIVLCNTKS